MPSDKVYKKPNPDWTELLISDDWTEEQKAKVTSAFMENAFLLALQEDGPRNGEDQSLSNENLTEFEPE
jgi:hypothetical protein